MSASGPSPRILIVDDSPDLLQNMIWSLKRARYSIDTAENGKLALQKIREGERPALVLLDLMMPVMSGWDFLEVRKQDPTLSQIPVIILSASVYRETPLTKGLPYLEKPFTLDELDTKVAEVLVASRLR